MNFKYVKVEVFNTFEWVISMFKSVVSENKIDSILAKLSIIDSRIDKNRRKTAKKLDTRFWNRTNNRESNEKESTRIDSKVSKILNNRSRIEQK